MTHDSLVALVTSSKFFYDLVHEEYDFEDNECVIVHTDESSTYLCANLPRNEFLQDLDGLFSKKIQKHEFEKGVIVDYTLLDLHTNKLLRASNNFAPYGLEALNAQIEEYNNRSQPQ